MTATGFLSPTTLLDQLNLLSCKEIADFGSGPGHFTMELARALKDKGRVHAFDVQDGPLAVLRSNAQHASLRNISTLKCNLEHPHATHLPDNTQDMVMMANVLYQSENRPAMIAEASRILKPNGQLVVLEWSSGAGNLGPAREHRIIPDKLKLLTTDAGLSFVKSLNAGSDHYGMIFSKHG